MLRLTSNTETQVLASDIICMFSGTEIPSCGGETPEIYSSQKRFLELQIPAVGTILRIPNLVNLKGVRSVMHLAAKIGDLFPSEEVAVASTL
jgi:hypothetical protein